MNLGMLIISAFFGLCFCIYQYDEIVTAIAADTPFKNVALHYILFSAGAMPIINLPLEYLIYIEHDAKRQIWNFMTFMSVITLNWISALILIYGYYLYTDSINLTLIDPNQPLVSIGTGLALFFVVLQLYHNITILREASIGYIRLKKSPSNSFIILQRLPLILSLAIPIFLGFVTCFYIPDFANEPELKIPNSFLEILPYTDTFLQYFVTFCAVVFLIYILCYTIQQLAISEVTFASLCMILTTSLAIAIMFLTLMTCLEMIVLIIFTFIVMILGASEGNREKKKYKVTTTLKDDRGITLSEKVTTEWH